MLRNKDIDSKSGCIHTTSKEYYRMTKEKRPLSPHLQVYKPQLTSLMSISHRATGIMLIIGFYLLVWFLGALAYGPDAYQVFSDIVFSTIGKIGLVGLSFCLFYHLGNGIRHLFWDMGCGLELKAVYRSGWLVIGFSVIATVIFWILIGNRI